MAATGKDAVKFYAVAAENGITIYNRFRDLNVIDEVKDCGGNAEKVLKAVSVLLKDDKAAKAVVRIVSGYEGVDEGDVTPATVLTCFARLLTDEDIAEAVEAFLALKEQTGMLSRYASESIQGQTA